jgi:hypothetical protein
MVGPLICRTTCAVKATRLAILAATAADQQKWHPQNHRASFLVSEGLPMPCIKSLGFASLSPKIGCFSAGKGVRLSPQISGSQMWSRCSEVIVDIGFSSGKVEKGMISHKRV